MLRSTTQPVESCTHAASSAPRYPLIGPEALQTTPRAYSGQDLARPLPILPIRRLHGHRQQQAPGVYPDVPLAARESLAGIVAADSPFSFVLTDWLSRIAALGASRPAGPPVDKGIRTYVLSL